MQATLEITEEFNRALHLLEKTNSSLFLTGKAGTGKSTLLNHFCQTTEKKIVVLAPTGVAALNVKGQTIHSFFNFGIDVSVQKIRERKTKPRDAKIYKKLQTIIIDEISMVRADILDCINEFLMMYGPLPRQAFGGVQMIFVGDLYQLPPVVGRDELPIFQSLYASPYFFSSFVMQHYPLEIVELEKIFRQNDGVFITLLNKIRNNALQAQDVAMLNSRLNLPKSQGHFYITLTTTNAGADTINDQELAALKGKLYTRKAEIEGNFTREYYPTAPDLGFKPESQVMMLNNDSAKRWVNGSLGLVEGVKKDDEGKEYVRVRLEETGRSVHVYPHKWEVLRFSLGEEGIVSEAAGNFTQYPFRLAWAVTIHKSQGKTFDHVVIDVGAGAFATGQIYVAFSRCTSFEGVILKTPLKASHIKTDSRIGAYMAKFRAPSDHEKLALFENAILARNSLTMTYLKGNSEAVQLTIKPVELVEKTLEGEDYLALRAYCFEFDKEMLFHTKRVLSVHAG